MIERARSSSLKNKLNLQSKLAVSALHLTPPTVKQVDSITCGRPLLEFPAQEDFVTLLALLVLSKELEEFCVSCAVSKTDLRCVLRACCQMTLQVVCKHEKQDSSMDSFVPPHLASPAELLFQYKEISPCHYMRVQLRRMQYYLLFERKGLPCKLPLSPGEE